MIIRLSCCSLLHPTPLLAASTPSLFLKFSVMKPRKDSNLAVETENVAIDAPYLSDNESPRSYGKRKATFDLRQYLDHQRSNDRNKDVATFKRKATVDLRQYLDQRSNERKKDIATFHPRSSHNEDSVNDADEYSPPSSFSKKKFVYPRRKLEDSMNDADEYSPPSSFGKKKFVYPRRKLEDSMNDADEYSPPSSFGKKNFVYPRRKLEDSMNDADEYSPPSSFGKNKFVYPRRTLEQSDRYSVDEAANAISDSRDGLDKKEPFSICLPGSRTYIGDKGIEIKNSVHGSRQILRSGMVLLKNYISLKDQVHIVNTCQRLGMGPGGFYQPGYQGGAKLRLQMMCLGRNWDPQTKYEEPCRSDGSEAPPIPYELMKLVKNALRDSHDLIEENHDAKYPEDELPMMSPDTCIVNFYTKNGRLGLHQDRDESRDSLRKGLPVVSFSIGDSAEFLYGDERDVNKAKEVLLESGDVLIFGGKSRHIFHGVRNIVLKSAPLPLVKETMLRPGRLNLTFRQF